MTKETNPIPEPPYLVTLDVRSFRGISIGAEHYYGQMYVDNKSNKGGYGAPAHPMDNTELQGAIQTQEEADALNEKDGNDPDFFMYEVGMPTNRFVSKEDVYKAALVWFAEHFNGNDVLVRTEECDDGDKLICISGSVDIQKGLQAAGSDYALQRKVLAKHNGDADK